ncbi:MAG: Tol-Pal system beta propeller repeat protein TolB [Kofleriaceae bacterium]|nr:Tol-Pal system beta propeller repeat protein TolB [Kofleriaceae bacterium]
MLQILPRLVFLSALILSGLSVSELGISQAHADDFTIDLNGPKRSRYPLAIPMPTSGDGATASEVLKVASFDLNIAGWFKVMNPKGFLANLKREGMNIELAPWKDVGAFGVIKFRTRATGGRVQIDFKLYELEKGETPVLERSYSGDKKDIRKLTHLWCNDVVKYFTGEEGFFGSKIAFVTRGGKRSRGMKRIVAMDFDGAGVHSMSRNSSINLLPAWSPSGGKLLYTSYMRNNPDIYVVSAGGGRPKRVSKYRGMNTGGSWSPDGSKMAVTLSKDGNPEIYIISASTGKVIKRLTRNRHIDTSPSWSPDGKEIAFVSDREGSPQIFVMKANGSGQRRVSMNGSYNTTPAWSPAKGARVLAYTTRDGRRYDIVTLNLASGKMTRITQNEGTNEEPSFAPNGRVIAFSSTRSSGSGIYLANADGSGNAVREYKGSVTSVDWGPTPKQ